MAEQATTSRTVRGRAITAGVSQHRIPDTIVTRGLGGQLSRHVGPGWYAVVLFADRRGVAAGEMDDSQTPTEPVAKWMADIAAALNHELHEDGHWVVAWTPNGSSGPQGEVVLLWRDGDGDPHVACEVAPTKGTRIEDLPLQVVLKNAEETLRLTAIQKAKLALSRSQVFRSTLGERIPTAR
jgi:hypothetical protein